MMPRGAAADKLACRRNVAGADGPDASPPASHFGRLEGERRRRRDEGVSGDYYS